MSENLSSPDPSPERKKNIRLKANEDLAVALKRAVHTCDCELIREILTSNRQLANYKIDPSKNIHILHKASQSDDANVVDLLIEQGADIDCLDLKKWTPLMIAAMHGHQSVVKCLSKHGANIGLEDIEGKTAREYAIEALETERAKKSTDLKVRKKVADLEKILELLPDDCKSGEINDEETPNAPQTKLKKDNKI